MTALNRCPFDQALLELTIEPPVVQQRYDLPTMMGTAPLTVLLRPEAVIIRCSHCHAVREFHPIIPEPTP